MEQNTLELEVRQPLCIRVQKDGEILPVTVEFDLPAVVALERSLNRSMKTAADWLRLQSGELERTLAAGLRLHHGAEAEQLAATICGGLSPESIETTLDAICTSACPRAMRRFREELEKLRAKARAGIAVTLPNGESAAVN